MANVKPSADVYIRTQFFEYKFLTKVFMYSSLNLFLLQVLFISSMPIIVKKRRPMDTLTIT